MTRSRLTSRRTPWPPRRRRRRRPAAHAPSRRRRSTPSRRRSATRSDSTSASRSRRRRSRPTIDSPDARRQGRPGRHVALDDKQIQETMETFQKEMQTKMTRAGAEEPGRGQAAFLAENEKKPGVQKTASGLLYEIVKAGDGPKPASTDTVKVHYRGHADRRQGVRQLLQAQRARGVPGQSRHPRLDRGAAAHAGGLEVEALHPVGPRPTARRARPAARSRPTRCSSSRSSCSRSRSRVTAPSSAPEDERGGLVGAASAGTQSAMSWSELERLEQRGPRANPWRAGRSHAMSRRGVVASSHSLATLAGRRLPAPRRHRDGRGDHHRRGARRGRADDDRHRRRRLLPLLRRLDAAASTASTAAAARRAASQRSHFDRRERAAGIAHDCWAAVTVPGAVSAWWEGWRRHGRLPFADLLAPAIAYAEDGFPVTEIVHAMWRACEDALRRDPEARDAYLPNGRAPALGDAVPQPAPRRVAARVAAGGADAFYRGPIAAEIARYARATGGFLEVDDFAGTGRVGGADRDDLPRLRGAADPAQRPGHRRAAHARPARRLRPGEPRPRHSRVPAPDDRGEEARLRRSPPPRLRSRARAVPVAELLSPSTRRSGAQAIDRRASAAGGRARRRWRPRGRAPCEERRGEIARRRRHRLPDRDRRRRQRGVVHQLSLRRLRGEDRRRADRHRAAQPRRRVHARARPSQRVRAAQAAVPHHHSRHGAARRHGCTSRTASWAARSSRRATSSS